MRVIWNKEFFIIIDEDYLRMVIYEKTKIGKVLKDLRKKSTLTQQEMANIIGMTKLSILKIEKGIITPKISTVCRWLRACNMTLVMQLSHDTEIDICDVCGCSDSEETDTGATAQGAL